MKNKQIIILISIVMLLGGCAKDTLSSETISNADTTMEPAITATATIEPTPIATTVPTQEPKKLKYIFYIIGDGMGEAHIALGEMAVRIIAQDMDATAQWESFDQRHTVTAAKNSASGGTALATGFLQDFSPIATDKGGNELYTILDRADQNGLATGVITNSYLSDATPATFTVHTKDRGKMNSIVEQLSKSDIDYLAGGGLSYLIGDNMAEQIGELDCNALPMETVSNDELSNNLAQRYPTMIMGQSTRAELDAMHTTGDYPDTMVVIPANVQLLCQGDVGLARNYDVIDQAVDLADLVRCGIGVLSNDDDGFAMMIEQGIIDKVSHNQAVPWIAQEMLDMNETLDVVMDFYSQHPEETLIVMTSDHETGYFTYDDDKYREFYTLPTYVGGNSASEIQRFLANSWDVNANIDRIDRALQVLVDSPYEDSMDNIAPLAGEIAAVTLAELGVYSRQGNHSGNPVPCYSHGVGAEEFASLVSIKEISPKICEVMGWEALPEAME